MSNSQCPVCRELAGPATLTQVEDGLRVDCGRCGKYLLTGTAGRLLELGFRSHKMPVAVLAHMINRMQRDGERPAVGSDTLELAKQRKLPPPREQADNFILWLGGTLKYEPGRYEYINILNLAPTIGASDDRDLKYVIRQLTGQSLIESTSQSNEVRLTFDGWARYEDLLSSATDSSLAFMAMPFGDDHLDRVFGEYFKPAIALTGYDLRRIDEKPRAGLIDDRLRVEIRRSRFMIAELTNSNRGAYWEAGFAEGLGRPVIYTCQKDYFNESQTHFDTNHHTTVLWEEDRLDEACEELKAIIRETLPEEAQLFDPED